MNGAPPGTPASSSLRALSVIFRAKIRDGLAEAGLLGSGLPRRLWRRKWVVHCQSAGSGAQVLQYIGRYLYRVAISNSRLESFEDGQVAFRYRDNRTGQTRRCNLDAEEFIRRFLQHTLPRGFAKVRSWGLFSARAKLDIEKARSLLGEPKAPDDLERDPRCCSGNSASLLEGERDPLCPGCGTGRLKVVQVLLPGHPARAPP